MGIPEAPGATSMFQSGTVQLHLREKLFAEIRCLPQVALWENVI
jgi:hypothetical protein